MLDIIEIYRETLISEEVKRVCGAMKKDGVQALALREVVVTDKDYKALLKQVASALNIRHLSLSIGLVTDGFRVQILALCIQRNRSLGGLLFNQGMSKTVLDAVFMEYRWLSFVAFICICQVVSCQTSMDAKNLKAYLFADYDTTILPVSNQSNDVDASVALYLLAINSLDEVSEMLKTTGFLKISWTDDFLKWKPNDFGGIMRYHWPQDYVWKPEITLKNSHTEFTQLGHTSLNVLLYNTGLVEWSPIQIFQSICYIDITYFPYDEQLCQMSFVVWGYTRYEVNMEGSRDGVLLKGFTENSAWEIVDTGWYREIEVQETTIVFWLKLRRKPLYNMLSLVCPVLMLATLNMFVFLLPCESGEKASFAVTVFLASTVFLTIMDSSFPQNSDTVSYFAIYVVIETVKSILITVIALCMLRCYTFEQTRKIPTVLITVSQFSFCKRFQYKLKTRNKVEHKEVTKEDLANGIDMINGNSEADDCEETGVNQSETVTWKTVVNGLDAWFFFFFFLTFLIESMVCLLMAKYH